MKKRTNSNIDLLKIICILLIIGHHYVYDVNTINSIDKSTVFFNLLYIGGKFGTSIFILITGYFMSQKEVKLTKIIKFILKIEFYSYLFLIIFNLLLGYNIDKINFVKSLIPFLSNKYWFATNYIILCFFIPYLNFFIKNSEKKEYIRLLLILTFFEVILPTVGLNYLLNNIIIFIYYYLIGGYVKKYNVVIFKNNGLNIIISMLIYVIMLFSTILIYKLSHNCSFFINKQYYFTQLNSIPVVISSFFLLLYFLNVKVKGNKLLSTLASSTFGVYLIHDNYFVKKYIFPNIYMHIYKSNFYELYSIIFIFMIMFFCSFIDVFITIIIDRLLSKLNKKK